MEEEYESYQMPQMNGIKAFSLKRKDPPSMHEQGAENSKWLKKNPLRRNVRSCQKSSE